MKFIRCDNGDLINLDKVETIFLVEEGENWWSIKAKMEGDGRFLLLKNCDEDLIDNEKLSRYLYRELCQNMKEDGVLEYDFAARWDAKFEI